MTNHQIEVRHRAFPGTIIAVTGNTLTLAKKPNRSLQVTVPADAKLMLKGQAVKLADLIVGTKVTVKGEINADKTMVTASRILINPGKAKAVSKARLEKNE